MRIRKTLVVGWSSAVLILSLVQNVQGQSPAALAEPVPEGLPPALGRMIYEDREQWKEMGLIGTDAKQRGVAAAMKVWHTFERKKITVCIESVSNSVARRFVVQNARAWINADRNFIPLDFGDDDANPRACDTTMPPSDIRVHFSASTETGGRWSLVGTDAIRLRLNHAPSMNLQGLATANLADTKVKTFYRRVVIHEFGHALGLEHEHQSPYSTCANAIDPDRLTEPPLGWTKNQISFNLGLFNDKGSLILDGVAVDKKSIMYYVLEKKYYRTEASQDCILGQDNNDISARDQALVDDLYPRDTTLQKKRLDERMSHFKTMTRSAGTAKTDLMMRLFGRTF
jgi:hypothetical protein